MNKDAVCRSCLGLVSAEQLMKPCTGECGGSSTAVALGAAGAMLGQSWQCRICSGESLKCV